MAAEQMEPLMTVEEVADVLKIKPKRVYELPIRKTKVGARVRYAPGDVRLYLALHTEQAAA